MNKHIISILFLITSANTVFPHSKEIDKKEIQEVLQTFMKCIKEKDSTTFYSLFHEDPVIWVGVVKDKTYAEDLKKNDKAKNHFRSTYKNFYKSISNLGHDEEKFYNININTDNHIAAVTFDYSFWEKGKKINWGKESWGLIKVGTVWKIVSVIFSVEYESINPEPEVIQLKQATPAHRQVRKLAEELLKVANLPGLSIAVRSGDSIVFAEGFGYADLENKTPVTHQTQFRAASTSKVITATALGKMMQDSIIAMDIPIEKYIPYFPQKQYPITARQLAGHIAGIPHYLENDRIENRFYSSVKDALTVFVHHDIIAKPGTTYQYSSHGITLLSAVMEEASGIRYLDYVQQNILNPLAMKSTEVDLIQYRIMPYMAKLYASRNGQYFPVKSPREMSAFWAAGGWVTTPTDLVNMTKAYSNGLLSKETVKEMFESQILESGEKTQVGIGWRLSYDISGRRVIEHAGVNEGARTVISYFPEEDLAISVMTNTEWVSSIEETAHILAQPFLEHDVQNDVAINGAYKIKVTMTQKGKDEVRNGTFHMKNGDGRIIMEDDISYSLIHLSHDLYALITHQGIYHMSIKLDKNKTIYAKAIRYQSQLPETPVNIKPFLTFTN